MGLSHLCWTIGSVFDHHAPIGKYENGEAFIDKYGRLIDSKSKKVIKELEHKGDRRPVIQRNVVMVQPPEEHPIPF